MQKLDHYITDILGESPHPEPIPKEELVRLPLYIRETYKIYSARIFSRSLKLVIVNDDTEFSLVQMEKHLNFIEDSLKEMVVLVSNTMTAISRRRLIEKGINFIVPGKQLFIPGMLLDLRESFHEHYNRKNRKKLLPSAQFILLYHIQHRYDKVKLTELSFKELAEKLGYTQMSITKAVENLRLLDLCKVTGVKEKCVRFEHERSELWHMAQPHFVNPVLKQVYIDRKPDVFMLQSNVSALPEYSNMNPARQEYYAIAKTIYYGLQKSGTLINENENEGRYCLEIWKYDPMKLAQDDIAEEGVVDPLSLYLSLKDMHDERIEMALDKIIEKYIW